MKKDINRREFLKRAGGAAMVMGGIASITGCADSGNTESGTAESGEGSDS